MHCLARGRAIALLGRLSLLFQLEMTDELDSDASRTFQSITTNRVLDVGAGAEKKQEDARVNVAVVGGRVQRSLAALQKTEGVTIQTSTDESDLGDNSHLADGAVNVGARLAHQPGGHGVVSVQHSEVERCVPEL